MFTLLAALMATVSAADTVPGAPSAPPAIQVSLNNDGSFTPGGLVQVRVQTIDDGYLAVFRVDGDGRVRVLFPLDPNDDAFIRGGKDYELRGREDRGTFLADDRGGSGMVYAALSHTPFQFSGFEANGHWDYNALRLSDSSSDAETDLTNLIAGMTNHTRFDYDAVGYHVAEVGTVTAAATDDGYYPGFYDPYYNPSWRCLGCGWYAGGSDFDLGFGYSPYWDPYLYSPWGYSAYGYGGFGGFGYFGGWFPGTFPIGHPRRPLPPGTRTRPRPGGMQAPVGAGLRAQRGVPPASFGTRARPRPADMQAPSRQYMPGRPAFRQPTNGAPNAPQAERGSRPMYREPPRSAPPPSARSAPPARSAPASRPAPARGGGGRGH